jgi:guanylate kinase
VPIILLSPSRLKIKRRKKRWEKSKKERKKRLENYDIEMRQEVG